MLGREWFPDIKRSKNRFTRAPFAPGVSVAGMMASLRAIRVSFWCVSRKTGFQSARASSTEGSSAEVSSRAPWPATSRQSRQSLTGYCGVNHDGSCDHIIYEQVISIHPNPRVPCEGILSTIFSTGVRLSRNGPQMRLLRKRFKGWIR